MEKESEREIPCLELKCWMIKEQKTGSDQFALTPILDFSAQKRIPPERKADSDWTETNPTACAMGAVCFHPSGVCGLAVFFYSELAVAPSGHVHWLGLCVSPGSVSWYQLSCSLAHRFDQPAVLMSQQRRFEPCRPTPDWTACAKTFIAAQISPCICSQLLKKNNPNF